MFSVSRLVIVYAIIAVLVVGAGAAYAQWASEGAGHGPTDAAGDGALIVQIDPAGVQGLYPGAIASVDFRVKNAADHPVVLRSARPYGFAVDTAHAGCLSTPNVVTGGAVVLHGNLAVGAWSPKHQVRIAMSKGAGDACKGAQVTFRLDIVAGIADA